MRRAARGHSVAQPVTIPQTTGFHECAWRSLGLDTDTAEHDQPPLALTQRFHCRSPHRNTAAAWRRGEQFIPPRTRSRSLFAGHMQIVSESAFLQPLEELGNDPGASAMVADERPPEGPAIAGLKRFKDVASLFLYGIEQK